MKGLRTTFELLPVLSDFPVIKPEVGNFGVNFVFFSKYARKDASNELSSMTFGRLEGIPNQGWKIRPNFRL